MECDSPSKNRSLQPAPKLACAGQRLRYRLQQQQLPITEFAIQMGISRQAIYGWINKGIIPTKFIDRAATLLDTDASWLAFGTESWTIDGSSDCSINCPLKESLINTLLQYHTRALELDLRNRQLSWHVKEGNEDATLDQITSYAELIESIPQDYQQMLYDVSLKFQLSKEPTSVMLPIYSSPSHQNIRWYRVTLRSDCGKDAFLCTFEGSNIKQAS